MDRALEAERLYSINELAELFGVKRNSVERFMRSGELPWVRVGAHRRVRASDVVAYLERHRPKAS